MNKNYLKLAVQKDGRLTEETLSFLRASGLQFESYKRRLFSVCRNAPVEILYVRDDDIPQLVTGGFADLGIIGQNVLNEQRVTVKKLLNLRYGFCTLTVSVPKDSPINTIRDLEGATIATSYPRSTKRFFEANNTTVKTVKINGSVEIAPSLGIAAAIADLTSTGSTLAINDLKALAPIYRSEAVLIANSQSVAEPQKKRILDGLMSRFKAVLTAKNYTYLTLTAPASAATKLKKIIPSLSQTGVGITGQTVTVSGAVKEDAFWMMLPRLKRLGVGNFIMLPIEKIIA